MATLQLDMFAAETETHEHAHMDTYIGTCKVCKRTSKRTGTDGLLYTGHLYYARCKGGCTHKGYPIEVEYRKIQGTYNPRIRCGFKCQTATGRICECSCRGANHGGR